MNTGSNRSGSRVIDVEKNASKISTLGKEFAEAERVEERRRKEEMEMRVRNKI